MDIKPCSKGFTNGSTLDEKTDQIGKKIYKSMVALYFVSSELDAKFVRAVTERGHEFIDFGIKADPGYSMYIVDADNADSSTGMIEILSYGHAAPTELIPIAIQKP